MRLCDRFTKSEGKSQPCPTSNLTKGSMGGRGNALGRVIRQGSSEETY